MAAPVSAVEEHPPFDCSACAARKEGERPDDDGRCAACRGSLIRRSSQWAWVPAAVIAAGYLWLLFVWGLLESTAMVFFLALGAGIAFVAYKIARRIAFDLLVTRGNRARNH
ncbi:hypothetical protein [Longimicrobium terrae]|uniref:Uncharacterized protein n=1 Tax=Longimicrobium terrae TaxID=1639882 RepID=A0A841GP87_9BACT|nr:hypothetical protein [Longimicrobium terrae]MBB4634380.1 hypothetical protein [Longimicrobium terrae]MBB6068730.1 hypothetical protein [Longimicrobium terrae]NNC27916.1 hypothetical protein [Longimicrobium terrae]